jgi:hypothetical protein
MSLKQYRAEAVWRGRERKNICRWFQFHREVTAVACGEPDLRIAKCKT